MLSPPFSRRLPRDEAPNALTIALQDRRARGAEVLDLTESNPTHAGLDYPADLLGPLADPASLVYDPDPRGMLSAREFVSRWFDRFGARVAPDRVLLCASTSEAYAWLFKLLCDPGDRVLVPAPSYPLFDWLAAVEGVSVGRYALRFHDGWMLDLDALAEACDARTRALIVVHPNNPTGSFLSRTEARALASFCAERGLALLCDEVFATYAWGPDPARQPTFASIDSCLCFSLGGLSKPVGLPQVKLGWIVASGPPDLVDAAIARLELIADTFLSVSTPVQVAVPRLLARGEAIGTAIRARAATNMESLQKLIQNTALTALPAEGGWYVTLRLPRTRPEEAWVLELLGSCGVLVHPGYFFDFPDEPYAVVSLLTPEATFDAGLTRLVSHVERSLRQG